MNNKAQNDADVGRLDWELEFYSPQLARAMASKNKPNLFNELYRRLHDANGEAVVTPSELKLDISALDAAADELAKYQRGIEEYRDNNNISVVEAGYNRSDEGPTTLRYTTGTGCNADYHSFCMAIVRIDAHIKTMNMMVSTGTINQQQATDAEAMTVRMVSVIRQRNQANPNAANRPS